MIDFLIMYEVGVREFESIALLGNELKRRGYSVAYLSFDKVMHNEYINQHRKLKQFKNNVKAVLMPSIYHNSELANIVYYVCGDIKKVINLRWEQYATNKEMNDLNAAFFPVDEAKKVFHVCWGKYSYDSLIDRGVDANKLLLVGAPQLDFVRSDFADYYLSKEKLYEMYGFNPAKQTVLYISSFGLITMMEKQLTNNADSFDGRFQYDSIEIKNMLESYNSTLDGIEFFLKHDQNTLFIYRPHPTENVSERLKKFQETYPNFRIILEHSVKQWILVCDKVVTWISTSLAEVYFSNRPCFAFRPVPIRFDDDFLMYKDLHFINTKETLLVALSSSNFDATLNPSPLIMDYCYNVQNKPAYLALCDSLEDIIKSDIEFVWTNNLIDIYRKSRRKIVIKSLVYNVLIHFVRFMDFLRKKFRFNYGKRINEKVKYYKQVYDRRKTDRLNDSILLDTIEKTLPIVNSLGNKKWEK